MTNQLPYLRETHVWKKATTYVLSNVWKKTTPPPGKKNDNNINNLAKLKYFTNLDFPEIRGFPFLCYLFGWRRVRSLECDQNNDKNFLYPKLLPSSPRKPSHLQPIMMWPGVLYRNWDPHDTKRASSLHAPETRGICEGTKKNAMELSYCWKKSG